MTGNPLELFRKFFGAIRAIFLVLWLPTEDPPPSEGLDSHVKLWILVRPQRLEELFWTPGHLGTRVRMSAGKSGLKSLSLCCLPSFAPAIGSK